MAIDFSQKLKFSSEDRSYVYESGALVVEQTILMEYQRHLMLLASQFLNSKFRTRFRYNWEYLIYLSSILSGEDNAAGIINTDKLEIVSMNIANSYDLLEKYIALYTGKQAVEKVKITHYKKDSSQALLGSVLNNIYDIYSEISKFLVGSYVHGSLGSMDYNDYSDIDMLVIVSSDSCKRSADLLKIREAIGDVNRQVFHYDPLQHHGIFVLSEIDLNYYPEAFLPLSVFLNSRVFSGNNELDIKLRDSSFDAVRGYSLTNMMLKGCSRDRKRLTNMDRIKRFNSNLLLLPSLYLETKGVFSYKRESFELIKEYVSVDSQYALTIGSEVRDKWNNRGFNFKFERFLIKLDIIPQYLVRGFCSRTVDKLYYLWIDKLYDEEFWYSLDSLLMEMEETLQ